MIYFIQDSKTFSIKIGYTSDESDPFNRKGSLQTGNPSPLVPLASMPGDRSVEEGLHEQFAAYRLSGEWFQPGPDLIRFLISLANSPVVQRKRLRKTPNELAEQLLIDLFNRKLKWEAGSFWYEAKMRSVTKKSLERACATLDVPNAVPIVHMGFHTFMWWVPEDWPHLKPKATQ